MVTIDISIEDISKLMGYDEPLDVDTLDQLVSLAISEVDSEPEGPDENNHTKVAIDVKTSNRPDLWGAEGIARLIRGKDEPGLPPLDAPDSGYEINVSPEVKQMRPYIGASVVRGLELSDFLIKQIIQIQDKVDFSFGRKRKRTSIGIYNINMIKSPIEYTVVDRKFKFQPLQFEEKITVDEIFKQHPKGIEYKHILDPYEKVPMLVDANNGVLSMPPVINSDDVGRVTEETNDVLVEVTGTNYGAVIQALAVVTQALRDRGGKVESVKINYPDAYKGMDKELVLEDVTPHSKPLEISIDPKDINRYLGTKISKKDMVELIRKRRNDAEIRKNKIVVKLAPYRRDVIHWVDVAEDVAIAYGYNNFEPTDAQVVTAGKVAQSTEDENMIRQVLAGLGLIEVLNYTLTNKESLSSMVNRQESWVDETCIEISNPVSSNFAFIRPELMPALIRFISNNKHHEYPQRVFETGESVIRVKKDVITRTSAAVALAGYDETFETAQSVLDTLTRLIGQEYSLEVEEHTYYLPGRSASIIIEGKKVGHIGEIHPFILEGYGIEIPMSALEIYLEEMPDIHCPSFSSNKND